jgi:glycosyltransferase involved in cell wall biosynthesis
VTPSLNQACFIEETIRSVLLQGYPNLEYIIIDGGSTDNSMEIVGKYKQWLSYWVSEPDNGQSNAINKGFARSSGEILYWINSDDLLQERYHD